MVVLGGVGQGSELGLLIGADHVLIGPSGPLTTLYRVDWWGLNPMASGSKTGYSKSFIETTPHSGCGNAPMQTYAAYSAHTAIISGITYAAQTSQSNDFACS